MVLSLYNRELSFLEDKMKSLFFVYFLFFGSNFSLGKPIISVVQSPSGISVPVSENIIVRVDIFSPSPVDSLVAYARLTTDGWKNIKEIPSTRKDSLSNESIINLGHFTENEKIEYTIFFEQSKSKERIWLGYNLRFEAKNVVSDIIDVSQWRDRNRQTEDQNIYVRIRGSNKITLEFASIEIYFGEIQPVLGESINSNVCAHDLNECTIKIPFKKDREIVYKVGYKKSGSDFINNADQFNGTTIDKFGEIQSEIVTINKIIRDIGYDPQACEIKKWDRSVDACHCCLVKYFGRSGMGFLEKIENFCKNENICSDQDLVSIKKSQTESSDKNQYIEQLYKETIVVPKISFDKQRDSGPLLLTENDIKRLLVQSHQKLKIDGFQDLSCIEVKNIKEVGGFDTESLFSVTTTCNKASEAKNYIIKEAKEAEYEVLSLKKVSDFTSLSSIILPKSRVDFPHILLPLTYLSYPSFGKWYASFDTLSIQERATGEEFCSFIQKSAEDISGNAKKIAETYEALGFQLAHFHSLNMDGSNVGEFLKKTVIHGDLKCANLFYNRNIEGKVEFTFIDNSIMERSILSRKSPIFDIANILFGHLAVGEVDKIRNSLDRADINSWYGNILPPFFKGYYSGFGAENKKKVMKDLWSLFRSNFSGNGQVVYDEVEFKNVLLRYVDPIFSDFFSEEDGVISELELTVQNEMEDKSKSNHFASPTFWGDQTVYSVMVDRFRNGDRSNDNHNISEYQKSDERNGVFSYIGKHRHGGDIKGIIDRLDYIVDLGVTTLMVSSVFENNGADYHGYCVSDFTKVDPNFGSNEELRNLVKEAHKRNLYVVLDVVVNHMCDVHSKYVRTILPNHHVQCAKDLSIAEEENKKMYSKHSSAIDFSGGFNKFFRNQNYFNGCGENTREETESERPVSFYGDFSTGMFDLNTTNHALQKIISDIMKYWIVFSDVDGFRLDAVKHISPVFTAYFSTKMREFASQIGKTNFGVFGEIAGTSKLVALHLGKMEGGRSKTFDDEIKSKWKGEDPSIEEIFRKNMQFPFPGLNGVYEFGHSGNAIKVLHNLRAPEILYSYFKKEDYRKDLEREVDLRDSMLHLEIHDWPRFGSYAPNDPYKSRLGLQYLAAAEGIPLVYYGQEQGFTGICPNIDHILSEEGKEILVESCKKSSEVTDPDYKPAMYDQFYRQDMFEDGVWKLGSTVGEINNLASVAKKSVGKTNQIESYDWKVDPFLSKNHFVYQEARKFLQIRKTCSALRWGLTNWLLHPKNTRDVFAFLRADKHDFSNQVLVVVNTNFVSQQIPDIVVSSDRSFKKINSENSNLIRIENTNHMLKFHDTQIEGNSVQLYIPEDKKISWDDAYQTNLCEL